MPFCLRDRHSNVSINMKCANWPQGKRRLEKPFTDRRSTGKKKKKSSQRREVDSCKNIPKHSGTGGTVRRVMAWEQEGKSSMALHQDPHSWFRMVCNCIMETAVPVMSTGASTSASERVKEDRAEGLDKKVLPQCRRTPEMTH